MPSRNGTRHVRTLGRPSTSHSHQPHWPVLHMRPRGRWNRKLRDRVRRPAASRLTARGSPHTPSYRRPSDVNGTRARSTSLVEAAGSRRAGTSADVERGRAVDAHALRLEVGVEAFHPEFAPDTTLLDAAERTLRQADVVRVHPDIPHPEPAGK